MPPHEDTIEAFLVHVFDDILRLEQADLRAACPQLSLSELHVLEAVSCCGAQGATCMAEVAAWLGVTPGTLTVAAGTLERKGFLTRRRDESDKRRFLLVLTPHAAPVLAAHKAFHKALVQCASVGLSPLQLEALAGALENLHCHFKEKERL